MNSRFATNDNVLPGDETAPIRVLLVHRWGVTMAGGERWILNLATHLHHKHVDYLAALSTRGPLYAALENIDIDVHPLMLNFLQAQPRLRLAPSSVKLLHSGWRLSRLISNFGVQIIHGFSPEVAEPAYVASRLTGIPMVITVMNCGPYPPLDVTILRRCGRVIAISKAVERDLIDAGVPQAKIARIPLGIAFADVPSRPTGRLREDLGLSKSTPLVGMMANLEPKKAQDVLIRALPCVIRSVPDVHLAFLGRDKAGTEATPGQYETSLHQIAHDLGLGERVHFLGFRTDAAQLVADVNVAVLCSRREAQGLAAIEALAARVPLVATDVEGLREVVRDKCTSLVVPPDDPDALGSAIVKLMLEREFAKRLADAGSLDVRKRFNASVLAQQNHIVYAEVHGKIILS